MSIPDRQFERRLARIAVDRGLVTSAAHDLALEEWDTSPQVPLLDLLQAHTNPSRHAALLELFGDRFDKAPSTIDSLPPGPTGEPVTPAPPPDEFPPQPRYQLERLLGRGSTGEVYLAIDQDLQRRVAIKVLAAGYVGFESIQARFRREIEITAHLEHPNIIPVYTNGRFTDGSLYFVMRYINGWTLREATPPITGEGEEDRFHCRRFLALLTHFRHACRGVHFAHSVGIIHRDLKPSNIMLDERGGAYVIDWGLAKRIGRPNDPTPALTYAEAELTTPGGVIGTMGYMSPEQAGAAECAGAPSDVFSLGATLYHLLTDRAPFQPTHADDLDSIRDCDFPPPRDLVRTVPEALQAICLKAMKGHADERYKTAKDLARAVKQWQTTEG